MHLDVGNWDTNWELSGDLNNETYLCYVLAEQVLIL